MKKKNPGDEVSLQVQTGMISSGSQAEVRVGVWNGSRKYRLNRSCFGVSLHHFFYCCTIIPMPLKSFTRDVYIIPTYRYQLMLSCWAANAEDRPSFTDLRNDLEEMLEADDELYISVNCDDFDYYCTLANNLESSSEVEEERLMSPMGSEAHHYV